MSIPIEKTLEEIREDLFSRISQVQQDGWLPERLNLNKGVVRGLIEIWAWGLYQLYLFLTFVLKQAFPSEASETWLDLHCGQVGVTRLEATKATQAFYWTREGTTGNVPIPAGRIVKTKPDGQGVIYRFISTEAVVMPDGASEVACAFIAEEYGTGSNITVGNDLEIATTVQGIDAVEIRADSLISEGTDRESDSALFERYQLAWLDVGGATKYAFMSWARSVAGVSDVAVIDNHPRGQGTVDVVLSGAAGMPTQALIDAVDAVVQVNRPINDDVLVKAPTAVDITVTAELELVSGDASQIAETAEAVIGAFFADLAVGEDVTLDKLVVVLMEIDPGVKKINWTAPAADVQIDADELGILQGVTITTTTATEV